MRLPGFLTAVSLAALLWAGCATVSTQQNLADVRTVAGALRLHQPAYEAALAAEKKAVTSVRDGIGAAEAEQIARTARQFDELRGSLAATRSGGKVRREALTPILRQLERERDELRGIADAVRRALRDESQLPALREALAQHRHPSNLLVPALQQIQQKYGVARQRTWHGRPLTA